ncbi:hypothetical protein VNO78_02630 [Psophocarpus tetragonolobus]|uniref:Folylpolyglutamate synthase n=1 Tax=Psophocarpus tetragonolobus TaxID=3891 RepID=A0AAN9XVA6_PSOTE
MWAWSCFSWLRLSHFCAKVVRKPLLRVSSQCERFDVDAAIIDLEAKKTQLMWYAFDIKEPTVCGITNLGMDHMEILGDTLGQIASHKAGILRLDLTESKVPLVVTEPFDWKQIKGLKLGLSGDHQFHNAALAVSLSTCWLQGTGEKNIKTNFENESFSDLRDEDKVGFLKELSGAKEQLKILKADLLVDGRKF